ncbi:MAG: diguanylate cyclase domain protein [Anaerocolumna sp.]|nr:diguanylate cyclase domain protein [Anaerocolumna sp.]
MVTAKVEGKDLKNAMELGAIDYIKKPIDEDEVIARVGSALRQKHNKEDLRDKASRDSLTGLYNHALLLEFLEKEIWQQERNNKSISFVMLDIDYFKMINDSYGHMAGDVVLRELSSILTKEIRSTDIPGRYGGEEFGIVLTGINREDTNLLCERIRETIENYVFSEDTSGIKATISIGFYFKAAEDRISCEDMVKCADDALYKAKQNGRNRVEEYTK